jgi:hypothetical protein
MVGCWHQYYQESHLENINSYQAINPRISSVSPHYSGMSNLIGGTLLGGAIGLITTIINKAVKICQKPV